MTKPDYFIQIHDARDATALHALRRQAETDGDLTTAELAQVNAGIGRKFSAMNHQAAGNQTPRWSPPARITPAGRCR